MNWEPMNRQQENKRGGLNGGIKIKWMERESWRKRWGRGWRDMEMVKEKWSEGYVEGCVFVLESQLLSPWGFKQLSRTVITHTCTHTHACFVLFPHIYTPPFYPQFPFFYLLTFFSFNPILGSASCKCSFFSVLISFLPSTPLPFSER